MSRFRFAWAAVVSFTACSSTEAPPEDVGAKAQTSVETAQVQLDGSTIPQFVLPLTTLAGSRVDGTRAIDVNMVEFQQKVLPPQFYPATGPFAAGTLLWGYAVSPAAGGPVLGPRWPAFTIEARRNTPTTVTYTNSLVGAKGAPPALQQFLPVDSTLHWADPIGTSRDNGCVQGDENGGMSVLDAGLFGGNQDAVPPGCAVPYVGPVPTVPHLHGAEVPSVYDGHPEAWFTPGLSPTMGAPPPNPQLRAVTGPAFAGNTYRYPNRQEATELWFHDHAVGVTRLDVYSGLAGVYLIRDDRDTGLPGNPITLPGGALEQELLIADRIFDESGQILFPDGSGAGRPQGFEGPPANANLHPFAIPELFGDVMTVNGTAWPFFEVEPRRYRFRVVNGSNARFLQMQLFEEATTHGAFNGLATVFTDPRGVGVRSDRTAGSSTLRSTWTCSRPAFRRRGTRDLRTSSWRRASDPTSSSTSAGRRARGSSSPTAPSRPIPAGELPWSRSRLPPSKARRGRTRSPSRSWSCASTCRSPGRTPRSTLLAFTRPCALRPW
jgi:hypothetical protein